MSIIKPNTCSTCSYKERINTTLQCRFNPPTTQALVVGTPSGPQIAGQVNVWPQVSETEWCGQWKRGFEVRASA